MGNDIQILEEYDRNVETYRVFTKKTADLIIEILRENHIRVHSVTNRVKDRPSLAKKLTKEEGNYTLLSDVTDIAGIRITTYLEDDVARVSALMVEEFEVDEANSVDKGQSLDPDRFGYLSMHHVVSLSQERCRLVEYKRFPHLKAEIQTRSILQHAWAEIEHDLGYKSAQEVPRAILRRFSRLAGLLELADQEFISIKNELSSYEREVPEQIELTPELVTLNKASLAAFVSGNEQVKSLDAQIASFCDAEVRFYEEAHSRNLTRLSFVGINTISELEAALSKEYDLILEFAKKWLTGAKHERLVTGVSLIYLCYLIVSRTQDTAIIEDYLDKGKLGLAEERKKLVEKIMLVGRSDFTSRKKQSS